MKIIRPEDYNGEPLLYRELTPEELAEAYRLAREDFTAADLQRFTEVDDCTSAEEFLAEMEATEIAFAEQPRTKSRGGGPPIRCDVRIAGEIRATISNLHAQARAAGTGAEFAAAVCRIVERLQAVPWEFGEPLCRLPALRLQLRQAILGPVAAVYAVHEDLGLVFFRRIKALSSVIGPEDRPTPPATGRIRIIRSEDYQGEPLLFRELTPDELAEAYRLARESFTAADLQEYTELDEGVPAEQVLAELEAAQQAFDREDQ